MPEIVYGSRHEERIPYPNVEYHPPKVVEGGGSGSLGADELVEERLASDIIGMDVVGAAAVGHYHPGQVVADDI